MRNPAFDFIQKALTLAEKNQGFCAPNPAVGAVVVRDGKVIAEGFHRGAGLPHAEVEALKQLDFITEDMDLYVTLEPCCHYGRTPPCTDLIIRRGIKRVFFAYFDPNPEVAGKGQRILQDAGIVCEYTPTDEVDYFYQAYQHWWRYRTPLVSVKLALTADRKTGPGVITGSECQYFTHQQRLQHDALLTTATTIIADDPQYNMRLIDPNRKKPLYVLDSQLRLPIEARIFTTCKSVTVFHRSDAPCTQLNALRNKARCIAVPSDSAGLDLKACLSVIGDDGHHSLWVEAGWNCTRTFIQQGLAEHIIFYFSSKIAGNQAVPKQLNFVYEPGLDRQFQWQVLGEDMLVQVSRK